MAIARIRVLQSQQKTEALEILQDEMRSLLRDNALKDDAIRTLTSRFAQYQLDNKHRVGGCCYGGARLLVYTGANAN